jgi:DNA-binding response OmpR family regulator
MAKKILVIDDNPQDMRIMVRFLGAAGYDEIVTAATGEEGVARAASEKPCLVVTDTILPGIDGFEVTKEIKAGCGPAGPRIIVVTGAIDAVDAVKARKMGADDYCAKTADCGPLLEAVKKLI